MTWGGAKDKENSKKYLMQKKIKKNQRLKNKFKKDKC